LRPFVGLLTWRKWRLRSPSRKPVANDVSGYFAMSALWQVKHSAKASSVYGTYGVDGKLATRSSRLLPPCGSWHAAHSPWAAGGCTTVIAGVTIVLWQERHVSFSGLKSSFSLSLACGAWHEAHAFPLFTGGWATFAFSTFSPIASWQAMQVAAPSSGRSFACAEP